MNLSRRALLAAPLLLAAEPPDAPAVPVAASGGQVALTWRGRGAVLLPVPPDSMRSFALAGLTLTAVTLPIAPGLSLLALCGGERPRLLGLEPLRWRGADGGHLETQVSTVTDGRRLRFARLAALPRDRLRWQRAEWIDFLAWQPPCLVDAPVRPVLAGSWQARLGVLRGAAREWLATPRYALTSGDLLALGYQGKEVVLF